MSVQDTSKGITISVTAETNAGGRRHMEDYIAVNLAPSEASFNEIGYLREQAFIGVFDGHGGKEAAKWARERLWEVIQKQPKFKSPDLKCVRESVIEGFMALHKEMEPLRANWKKNKMGDLSTAGTTASTVIFRQDHIIVANVGDSTAVLAEVNPLAGQEGQHAVRANTLTIDHKPEDPNEIARIETQGGKVMRSRKGVPRVVWQRERKTLKTTEATDSTDAPTTRAAYDIIPFLSVARSLGDFWSFSPATNEFVVSPCPDVHILPLVPKEQKFVVIASDGLWNVMTPTQVVQFIWDYEHDEQTCHQPRDVVKAIINEALKRWKQKNLLADNISVLIAFLLEEEAANAADPALLKSATEASPSSNTILPREGLLPAATSVASTSSPVVVELHTRTKLRHRRKEGSSRHYITTLSPYREEEANRRKRKRVKCEETAEVLLSPTKKSKLETDSGFEADNPLLEITLESPTDSTESLSNTVGSSRSEGVGDEEDSSGVSSDNSEPPEGMPQHDMLLAPATVLECST